jgi:hypothetical protein
VLFLRRKNVFGIVDDSDVLIGAFAAPLSIRSVRPVFVSDSMSLRRFVAYRGDAQRWIIETEVVPMRDDSNSLMVDFVVKGIDKTVLVRVPQNYSVMRKNEGSSGTATGAVGSTSISVTGANKILKGTFFNFGRGQKVYMATSDLIGTSLQIFPRLRTAISGAQINYGNNVIGSFIYDVNNLQGMSYVDGVLFKPEKITLLEKV